MSGVTNMTSIEYKEANRYYWIVKGHLIPDAWSEKDIMSVYNGYFDRIWGNHENVVHEDGFEEAWSKKMSKN
jgi:hypothetical protein